MSESNSNSSSGLSFLGGLALGPVVIVAIVGVVILLCCACCFIVAALSPNNIKTGEKVGEINIEDEDYLNGDDSSDSANDSTAKSYKQSEKVKVDDVQIAITEVKNYTSSNQYIKPDDGYRFLAIMVEVENTSEGSASYNSWYFSLKNKDGVEYDSGYADIEPDLNSGTLQLGKKAKGYIVFEVPKNVKTSQLELIYEPISFGTTTQVIWELK
jgi:hypothetical protein